VPFGSYAAAAAGAAVPKLQAVEFNKRCILGTLWGSDLRSYLDEYNSYLARGGKGGAHLFVTLTNAQLSCPSTRTSSSST
jgi:hypothetical protein